MKKFFALFCLLCATVSACSDDTTTVTLCDCREDEYCRDDKCYKTDAEIAPAPDETESIHDD
ncbi:MAG: hypothetical protein IKY83_02520 [Proteobacteria bacterium]|nr:hypothetical protein [Pseudomonadota bacterium]